MPEIGETLRVKSRAAWRRWLQHNHRTQSEIWLILFKKHVNRPGLSYEDATNEALCFGWIDGILKRIDDEKHALRFSPRRPNSVWSDANKRRVRQLIRDGQMTEAGLDAVRAGKKSGKWQQGSRRELTSTVPEDLQDALTRSEKASQGFAQLAPSHRRQYVAWILEAKREQTRRRRVSETVRRVVQGKRPGID
jgi:uncharacterized protein YdeI (YjbR/CyaY-like superfamily)